MNLPVSRRGFLGTLAGLVLGGRIIGPKLLKQIGRMHLRADMLLGFGDKSERAA